MLSKLLAVAALCAAGLTGFAFDPPEYNGSFTRQGVSYAQRGGLGARDYVVTNIVVNGQPRPLPQYLYLMELDDTYPDDAEWYYQHADYRDGGHCSVRRSGNAVERNYDWHFDDAATFVLKVGGAEGRFASVGVANVGTNLTDGFVRSGAWSRYYKCLAGHTTDGINENGLVAEVNVTSGSWGRTSGAVHGLGAVRWALDHGTNAQQAAEFLAANVYLPQGFGVNFHYLIADATKTFIVENCEAHEVTAMPAVMTNFNLDRQGGEGYERYASLTNGATIESQWWTLAYNPETRPVRTSDLGGEAAQIWAAWNDGRTKEQHRGESFGGVTWWQTVHCSKYDIPTLTLRIAVQEIPDWYAFTVPTVGKVKSVNGRVGEVELDAAAVNALPDDEDELVNNENFKGAVATVSPPVELPAKWALANVTNAQGQAVTAEDVNALDNWEASANIEAEGWQLGFPYYGHSGRKDFIYFEPSSVLLFRNGQSLDIGFGGVRYVNERGGVFNSDWFDFVTKDTVVKSIGGGDEDMPPSVGALRTYLGQNYTESYIISRDYLKKSEASSTYETQSHASSTYETQSHASATYAGKAAIADAATALSNRVNDAKNEITVIHATDGSQYINGKGEVYRPSGTPPVELVMPNTAFNSYIDFEMTYDEETHRYFTDNRGFINCYGPRGGGATMLFMFYQDAGSVHQWVLYGNNSWVVDTADDDPTADWLHFQYSGMWRRPTSSGTVHADDLAYKSDLEGISPADYETVSNRAMHAVRQMDGDINILGGAGSTRDANRSGQVSIGYIAKTGANGAIAIGQNTFATNSASIALGIGAHSHGARTFNVPHDIGSWYAGDTPIVQALQYHFVERGVDPETGVPLLVPDTNDPVVFKHDCTPVNPVAQFYDTAQEALWSVYMTNGDMKYSCTTNTDTTELLQVNSVLTDTATTNAFKVIIRDADMKFYTK